MNKCIPLKNRKIIIKNCGECSFFEYDTYSGEYHKCKLNSILSTEIYGIPPIGCPLIDSDIYKNDISFTGCFENDTQFKGFKTWPL
jgi:hypothetical protein